MKNIRIILIVFIVTAVLVVAGLLFWPLPASQRGKVKRAARKPGIPAVSGAQSPVSIQTSGQLLSSSTTTSKSFSKQTSFSATTGGMGLLEESPFEFHQYSSESGGIPFAKDTGYRGIGERDLFALLIPPPPPPAPERLKVASITRNWVLWEIVDGNECVIADARPLSHNLHIGEQLEGVVVNNIVLAEDRVQLAKADNKEDTRWLQLQPISLVTNGWKIKGIVSSLKTAFIVTGDNVTHKVREGDICQHCLVKQVLSNKVILSYGTMTRELKP